MFDTIAKNYGVNAPQTAATSPSWTQGMTSDQQLARYWQMLKQIQVDPVAPDYTQNSGSGDNAVGGGDSAATSMASNLTEAARNAKFEASLSPEDLANYQALSQQHTNDANHYSNNLGWLSLAAPLAVYGGYTAAGAAGGSGGAAAGAAEGGAGAGAAGGYGAAAGEAGAAGGAGGAGLGAAEGGFIPAAGGAGTTAAEVGGSAGVLGGAGGAEGAAMGAGGSGSGFWGSLASGDYGSAASAAGDYLTSPSGMTTASGLVSSYLQNRAAGNALDAQTNATHEANALQKYMYDTNRADWAPYRALGAEGTAGYSNLLKNPGSITSDPGYQFGLTQGQTAIDHSAASKGGLYSGATLKALERYGQDYGGTKLNDAFGRFSGAAQLGATGTSGTQASGTNYVNQASANTTGLGNAAAGNALLQGNIWGNALNGAVSAYKNYNTGG